MLKSSWHILIGLCNEVALTLWSCSLNTCWDIFLIYHISKAWLVSQKLMQFGSCRWLWIRSNEKWPGDAIILSFSSLTVAQTFLSCQKIASALQCNRCQFCLQIAAVSQFFNRNEIKYHRRLMPINECQIFQLWIVLLQFR